MFDYSKGKWTAVTANTSVQVWEGSSLVDAPLTAYSGNTRKVIMKLCGFANAGTGKLIGPDGSEIDTESFLSDLRIYGTSNISGSTTPCNIFKNAAGQYVPLLFRVVTQIYGQGIVTPTSTNTQTVFNNNGNANGTNAGNGGSYNDICSQDGCIYLEVDLSCPICADCDATSLDGYTGSTIYSGGSTDSFAAFYRRYANLEFEDEIGEVSFDLESVTVSVTERKLRAQWSPELDTRRCSIP